MSASSIWEAQEQRAFNTRFVSKICSDGKEERKIVMDGLDYELLLSIE
jgi:hypothetical protein